MKTPRSASRRPPSLRPYRLLDEKRAYTALFEFRKLIATIYRDRPLVLEHPSLRRLWPGA